MTQNITLEDWEAEQMRDPEFRAAVEELEPEYQRERRRMSDGKRIKLHEGERVTFITNLPDGTVSAEDAFIVSTPQKPSDPWCFVWVNSGETFTLNLGKGKETNEPN